MMMLMIILIITIIPMMIWMAIIIISVIMLMTRYGKVAVTAQDTSVAVGVGVGDDIEVVNMLCFLCKVKCFFPSVFVNIYS